MMTIFVEMKQIHVRFKRPKYACEVQSVPYQFKERERRPRPSPRFERNMVGILAAQRYKVELHYCKIGGTGRTKVEKMDGRSFK